MSKAILKPREERRLLRGHLWAYRNEFAELPELLDGSIVDVVSDTGRLIGRGFYQSDGGIAVRLLSSRDEEIDAALVSRRIARAKRFREMLYAGETVYRWVFGESDGLPGLVADRYGSVVVVETACAFYENLGESLAQAFLTTEGVNGIRIEIGRSVREFGVVPPTVEVTSFGVRFQVHLQGGQKTGLFLDQRENCMAARAYFRGARVFDGFSYAGQWGLHAMRAGASSVVCVDTSQPAIDMARANAELNGFTDAMQFRMGDVHEALRAGTRYDVVIVDPPALAKTRGSVQRALGAYQSLNRDAMQAVEPGGYLITSSCSHFVDEAAFLEMLKRATRAAQRPVWILETRGAARDHPVLMAMPETAYLKCAVLRVF